MGKSKFLFQTKSISLSHEIKKLLKSCQILRLKIVELVILSKFGVLENTTSQPLAIQTIYYAVLSIRVAR